MPNLNSPKGFQFLYSLAGLPTPLVRVRIPASDSTAVFAGDPVIYLGSSDATGVADVIRATAGSTGYTSHVIESFEAVTDESTVHRAASTERYALARLVTNNYFVVQADTSATPAVGNVGANADFTFATAGSTVYGFSGCQLSTTSIATTNTLQLRIHEFLQAPDNEVGASAKFVVSFNLDAHRNLTGI
jgi:hypothetical protein